jgi:signal transduction histidine kinase
MSNSFCQESLNERIKELRCLYQITELSTKPEIDIDSFFRQSLHFIKQSLLHPDLAIVIITVNGKIYSEGKSNNTKDRLFISSEIAIKNIKIGKVEVFFCKKCSEEKAMEFLKEEQNLLVIIAGLFSNFIERKQSEQALIETNKNLEEIINVASHDLKVPLVSIEGYASELLAVNNNCLNEDSNYCLKRLQINARRMNNLVDSLLDISRLTSNNLELEHISLNNLFEKVISDLSLLFESKRVKIKISKLPSILADKVRIESVFRNLLINAINYGSTFIEVFYKNGLLCIKDNGIGIPEGQLENIFNPGERLKILKIDGIGMGLTFAKKVISLHKGEIWAQSEGQGKGSVFFIKF